MKKIILLSLLLAFQSAFSQELVIVVSKENPYTDLKLDEISNIYLGKMNFWPKGQRISATDLPDSSFTKACFLKEIVKKKTIAFESIWLETLSKGNPFPLVKCLNSEKVKEFLQKNPFAIGYLLKEDVDSSVKTLKIDGENTIKIKG
ncbi:hypothetical protein IT568_01240 [bacterium]|nr:hypothetical protein [bacterium]